MLLTRLSVLSRRDAEGMGGEHRAVRFICGLVAATEGTNHIEYEGK